MTTEKPPNRRSMGAGRLCILVAFGLIVLSPRPAPGTIAEQRARLPPPARCTDDIEGLWISHQYDPRYNDWTQFFLDIRRVEDSETDLVGTIRNHSWDGGPELEEPGPCVGNFRYEVSMEARGRFDEWSVEFWGTAWQLDGILCGRMPGLWHYNLDNFSGTVDFEIQEFQSVNNDGGRAVDDPTVFRRIECYERAEDEVRVDVEAPSYTPEAGSDAGCWG